MSEKTGEGGEGNQIPPHQGKSPVSSGFCLKRAGWELKDYERDQRGKRDQGIDVSPQRGTGKIKGRSEQESLPVYSLRHGLGRQKAASVVKCVASDSQV